MKKILCYGDSNTFGLNADNMERHPKTDRWSGVLSEFLSDKYEIIEQGLNDRNGFMKNEKGPEYCALENLPVCLKENPGIDIVILAVGTNDLQFVYDFNENVLKSGMLKLIDIIREYNNYTKIIIIPPVKLSDDVPKGFFGFQFDNVSVERSEKTFPLYKEIADQIGCYYFDFNEYAVISKKDGLHFLSSSHRFLAEKLSEFIRNNL